MDTVRTWRGRFAVQGLAGLRDLARSGRPARFTPVQVAQVKALACQLPARVGAPLARWSCPELAREAVLQNIAEQVSPSTVHRWLAQDAIKPWQFRSWIFPRDPDFTRKAERVLTSWCTISSGIALTWDVRSSNDHCAAGHAYRAPSR